MDRISFVFFCGFFLSIEDFDPVQLIVQSPECKVCSAKHFYNHLSVVEKRKCPSCQWSRSIWDYGHGDSQNCVNCFKSSFMGKMKEEINTKLSLKGDGEMIDGYVKDLSNDGDVEKNPGPKCLKCRIPTLIVGYIPCNHIFDQLPHEKIVKCVGCSKFLLERFFSISQLKKKRLLALW